MVRDLAIALAMPVVMCAGGIYAAGETWWRRRRRARPSHARAELRSAAERAVTVAEAVVADQYALLVVADGESTGAKTSEMRHHERPVTRDRIAEGRSGEAP
ncbi:hypothetical protein [Streptomyces sp. NPDC050264]|uniref:hypothetical protein n=1 Tax=Streptomyces sp. NPDC050264 TaxID=3155038 RepID=UPI00342CE06D